VREVAEDAFDSAEETFRHFVMDVSTHNKHHPEDAVVGAGTKNLSQRHRVGTTLAVTTHTHDGSQCAPCNQADTPPGVAATLVGCILRVMTASVVHVTNLTPPGVTAP
jgi:hypothetical protein